MSEADIAWTSMPMSSASERVNETTDPEFDTFDWNDSDMLGMQEATGYDVEYEKDPTGRNKRMRIIKVDDKPKKERKTASSAKKPQVGGEKGKKRARDEAEEVDAPPAAEDEALVVPDMHDVVEQAQGADEVAEPTDLDMLSLARQHHLLVDDDAGDDGAEAAEAALPGWKDIPLHPRLKRALASLQFTCPTAVQAQTLPPSLGVDGTARDVVGIAQTGSGKTLAYGLPILQYVLEHTAHSENGDRALEALVLAPTRELALQVTEHLRAVTEAGGRFANVAAVCGGMSIQKQRRMLEQHGGAHIVVATPGRLWDLLRQDDHFALRLRQARFLVIDEADRMVEAGHFAEMDAILAMVRRTHGAVADANPAMQTFVYSATMAKALQTNLKRAQWRRRKQRDSETSNTLEDLLSRVDFRDAEPLVVELTPLRHVSETLAEAKVECLAKEKDTYLYYILLRYPGRTLVFLNAIDGVRRLVPLLSTLGIHVYALHGQQQQQQRLRNLDRFRKASGPSVLLATDVAARGIDVPGVDLVVHYQLPRSADMYVHRAGRTARAGREGVSIALIEPGEQRVWRDMWQALQRDDRVETLPIEYTFLAPLRERLALARDIDQIAHRKTKEAHDDAWLRQLADDAEIDFDEDESDPDADYDAPVSRGRRRSRAAAAQATQLASLRQRLAEMLSRPLTARGVSQKYITSGSRTDFVKTMLAGKSTWRAWAAILTQMHLTCWASSAARRRPTWPQSDNAGSFECILHTVLGAAVERGRQRLGQSKVRTLEHKQFSLAARKRVDVQ